jgi:hypothetical protein
MVDTRSHGDAALGDGVWRHGGRSLLGVWDCAFIAAKRRAPGQDM